MILTLSIQKSFRQADSFTNRLTISVLNDFL